MSTKTLTVPPLAGTISEDDLRHREAFWDFVLTKAEPAYRAPLTRLLGVWEDANARYYGGVLKPPIILLAEPSNPRRMGDCGPVSGWGARSQIRIRRSLLEGTYPHLRGGAAYAEGRLRFVADVLVHEQIHQWQQEITGEIEGSYHGHGPRFCAKGNEIGSILGLGAVSVKKRPKHDDPRCAQWPHNVRAPDYYLGAYVPPNRDTDALTAEMRELARCQRYLERQGYTVTAPPQAERQALCHTP